jgi:hypothetical protein
MFHLINVFGIIIVFPVLSICINLFINSRKNIQQNIFEIILGWLIFWSLGVRTLSAGLMQIFNPIYTNNLLQLEMNDFIIIREHGLNNFGIGLLCIISFFKHSLRKYACMIILISFTGFSILHITRMEIIDFDEIITLIANLFMIIVSFFGVINETIINFCSKNKKVLL